MENKIIENQDAVNQIYDFAANLLVKEKKNPDEVEQALMDIGVDIEGASIVVANLETQIQAAKNTKKDRSNNDIIYGTLWCVGGIILTVADFGYIFWGAIVFGGYQLIRGLINS
jgi:hypothetical protein